jgi:hypothetical protein
MQAREHNQQLGTPEQQACLPDTNRREAAETLQALVHLVTAAHAVVLHLAGKNQALTDADVLAAVHRFAGIFNVPPERLSALLQHIAEFRNGRCLPNLPVPAPEPYALSRRGQMWVVTFGGQTMYLRDALGPAYIAHLIAAPRRRIPAPELWAAVSKTPVAGKVHASSGDEQTDGQTLEKVHERYLALREEIEVAERNHDLGRQERVQKELDQLSEYCSQVKGLGGRLRRASDDVDKMRRSIRQAIDRTLAAIRKRLPAAARHLDNAIRTGRSISYEPEEDLPWTL